ncbi:MAG: ThuA domain-containing protein, partial [Planctomycetes bacterium]|nr:ThuA domain-containing protein [Planctomycetota bacterium]
RVLAEEAPAGRKEPETEAKSGAAPAEGEKPQARVVIVTGNDYPGHLWRQTAPVLARSIRKDRRLEVRVVETADFLASPELKHYDVIVLHYMNWESPDPGADARDGLKRFVAGGKGLVLVHFACGAFQGWDEFVKIAGRVWDPKMRAHDPRGPFRVEIKDPEHPITKGMKAFDTDDELYTCLAGETPIRVLATARSKVDEKDYAMAFTLEYGKGRVFHSPLGHDVKALEVEEVGALFRRGCAWAARLEVEPRKPGEEPVPPAARGE